MSRSSFWWKEFFLYAGFILAILAVLLISVLHFAPALSESSEQAVIALFLIAAILLVAVPSLVSYSLLRRFQRDIAALARAATKLTNGPEEVRGLSTSNLYELTRVLRNLVQQLLKVDKVRRDFVANVSHELRTPITSIRGFVETLLDGALHDQENAEKFLRIIVHQSTRLSDLIDDLLLLSWIEMHEEMDSPGFEESYLQPILADALSYFEQEARRKEISLSLRVDAALRSPLHRSLLQNAVSNLINNAVKYTTHGGMVSVHCYATLDSIVVEVVDNGPGIAQEHQERIFERFYRIDKSRSRDLGGTGLGLAIVKHVANLHRGSVTLQSAPGSGSTFVIKISRNLPSSGESDQNLMPRAANE